MGKGAVELGDRAERSRAARTGTEVDRSERKPLPVGDIGREVGNSAHWRSGAGLPQAYSPLRKSAAGHLDIAVDPQPAQRPVISHPAAAGEICARTVRAVDIGVRDAHRAAAGEVHDLDVPGRVEAVRSPQHRIADAGRDRADRCFRRGRERLGHAGEHAGIERGAVGGIVANQIEDAVLAVEPVSTAEPRPVRIDRRHPRLLCRQNHPAVNIVERAIVGDLAGEIGEPVGACDEGRDRHSAAAVHVAEQFVEDRFGIEARRGDVEAAGGTGKASERQRPIDVRMARDDRDRDKGAQVGRDAAPRLERRTDNRGMTCKAAAKLAVAGQRKSDRSKGRGQRNRAVGDVQYEIGQSERFVARRRHQLVNLAPADAAVDQLPAEPNSARDDAVNFEATVPFQPRFDLREARHEVGVLWIADDQVADLLGPQADPVEVVCRGDAAPLQLAFQIMGGDRPPLDPDERDRSDQHHQEPEREEARDAAPSGSAPDDECLFRASVVRPFRHWPF